MIRRTFLFSETFGIYALLMAALVTQVLSGCRKDLPPPLDCDTEHPGLICREDAFRRGEFIGNVDYVYDSSHQLREKRYYSTSGSYLREIFEYDDRQFLVSQKDYDRHGELVGEKRIMRTAFDSVAAIHHFAGGDLTGVTTFEYDDQRRKKIRYDQAGEALEYLFYQYGDDGRLYSETLKSAGDVTLWYKIYRHYQPNITRVWEYSAGDALVRTLLILRDETGNTLEIREYDQQDQEKSKETFLRVNGLLLKHAWLSGNQEIEFRIFHYP